MLNPLRHMMVVARVALFALMAGACGAGEGDSDGAEPASGGGAARTTFSGSYRVPVSGRLAPAAEFFVRDITWTVKGTEARLSYKLPRELVGKSVSVDFSGQLEAGTGTLLGEAGVAECSVASTEVACAEEMYGLLPLESDLAAVERLAAESYAGPASDRVEVARVFQGDPIGIAVIDLTSLEGSEPHETEGP
jgi:hypothetical protein